MPIPSPSMGVAAATQDQAPPQPQSSPQPSLLGPQGTPPTPAGPSPEQQSAALMAEIRDLTMRITSIARQFPDCADELEVASQSLINAMQKIIISQSNTEPMSAPSLVG